MRIACLVVLLVLLAIVRPAEAAVDPRQACPDLRAEEVYAKDPRYGPSGEIMARFLGFSEFRRSAALVIGVGDYQHWKRLEAPPVDADNVRRFLVETAGFDYVVTLKDGRASLGLIDCLMEAFPDFLGPNDRFLFYFSGHGTQRMLGQRTVGYLALRPSPKEGSFHTMLSMDRIERWSGLLGETRHTLFVLDACFSGLAGRQTKSDAVALKKLDKLKEAGHWLVTAGAADEESVASLPRWGGSLFTRAFLDAAMGRAGADAYGDGVVSLKEVMLHVEDAIVRAENADRSIRMSPQISELRAERNDGEFFFLTPAFLNTQAGNPPETPLAYGQPKENKGPAVAAGPALQPVEQEAVVIGTTNVRAAPDVNAARVAQLAAGTRIYVTAKVEGQPWYLVERDGERLGYVFERLMSFSFDRAMREEEIASAAVEPVQPSTHKIGAVFRDCAECPELVVVPSGSFEMGSSQGERDWVVSQGGSLDWTKDEQPRHRVTISQPFAVSMHEVRRGEFARFVAATGYKAEGGCYVWTGSEYKVEAGASWRLPRYEQTDAHPAVCVSWSDAQAYVRWLSGATGKSYRLLSEAEWEYAARAGTAAMRYWGDDRDNSEACRYANGADQTAKERFPDWTTVLSCRDGYVYTAPVGGYGANGWQLRDVLGNVWEWVADCYHESYEGAPVDGRAWVEDNCPRRVLRGGSWFNDPRFLRSADRVRIGPEVRIDDAGFRVARMLTP